MTARRWLPATAAIGVAAVAFVYRYLTHAGFTNDQFINLARAQAMLAGDLPIRDYTEEGVPLMVAVSAVAWHWLGQSPLAELLLSVGSLALAAGLTCLLASRLTGSVGWGGLAAVLQIVVEPRLYSHPKMFIYTVAAWGVAGYVSKPTPFRLAWLAIGSTLAFLIRHDHGVYVGLACGCTIVATHYGQGWEATGRRLVRFVVIGLLAVAPYLAYVQYYQGLVSYFAMGLAISETESTRTNRIAWGFERLPNGPWLRLGPDDPEDLAVVRVRWQAGTSTQARQDVERRLGLHFAEFDQGTTWKYRVGFDAREVLAALLERPEVEDTGGFDRGTLELETPAPVLTRVLAVLHLDTLARLELGPPGRVLLGQRNVEAALYFFIRGLPILTVGIVLLSAYRGRGSHVALGLSLSSLAAISAFGLLRHPLDIRIPDTYGSVPLLLVCTLAWAWQLAGRHPVARIGGGAAIAAAAGAVLVATIALSQDTVGQRLENAGLTKGIGGTVARAALVTARASEWPWSYEWPAGQVWKVARYVHDCTQDGDRLLVTWNAPEVSVFARRAFAGGETVLMPPMRPPRLYEPLILARLGQHPVPIVLTRSHEEFSATYPAVGSWIAERYTKVGHFGADERDDVDVYVANTSTPSGTDPEFGWPCFR